MSHADDHLEACIQALREECKRAGIDVDSLPRVSVWNDYFWPPTGLPYGIFTEKSYLFEVEDPRP